MADANGQPTLEEIRAERERRARSTRNQAAAAGQPISVEAIRAERQRRANQPRQQPRGDNLAHQFGTGVAEGTAGTVAAVGDAPGLLEGATGWVAERLGMDGDRARAGVRGLTTLAGSLYSPVSPVDSSITPHPTSEQLNSAIQSIPGVEYAPAPTSVAGSAARTLGQFTPGAAFPGSTALRAARVAVPAATSETAGQVARQVAPEYETAARVAGGFAGGLATEAALAGQAGRAARNAPLRDAEALEQEFGPLTRGERSGNAQARSEEIKLRRGQGPERAQAVIRGFDADRAAQARGNAMRIVSRGQEPISQDVGEAGQILGDELRTARQAIRDSAREQYDRAFTLAKGEQLPQGMNDLPSGRVQVAADDLGFEIPAPAQRAIGALERKIAEGRATQADVETARQGLNRELSTAINARQDAVEFVYSTIINTLDEWQGGLVRSPEARRAMQEARGIYAEGAQLYGQRGRTELSSGHTGRIDPGGRAVDRAINTDLTGEQIIDSIVGAGRRPSQQALGAVQRIKQLGTETIKYTNRNAEGGVRVPGRRAQRELTQGSARFDADSPNYPGSPSVGVPPGVSLPTGQLQALREGLWHRVLGPLDEYGARVQASGVREGGLIPAQRMVTALDNALNRSGREIMAVLYTPREIAAMQRFLRYMQRIVPPEGVNWSGTAQALGSMISKAVDTLAGFLPVVGQAWKGLRHVADEWDTVARAERAVAPLRPRRAAPAAPAVIEEPNMAFPAFAGAMGVQPEERQRRLGAPYP